MQHQPETQGLRHSWAGRPDEGGEEEIDLVELMYRLLEKWKIIVLACIIFSLFAAAPPAIDPNAAAVTQVWSYIGELVFNMLVLVGAVKMADRVVREMMGL